MGSNFSRKIGMGMLHIVGFLERGCQKLGVLFVFCDASRNPANM